MPDNSTNRLKWEPMARQIAEDIGINADVFCDLITQESQWDAEAVSPSGARGLPQLMPRYYQFVDLGDPPATLRAAAETIKRNLLHYSGDYAKALAAYNGGMTAIDRWCKVYGKYWRRALKTHDKYWLDFTGYGDWRKAKEVARYLDKILGPEGVVVAEKPPIERMSCPNYTPGRRGKMPIAIVDHIAEGSLEGCDSWFGQTASQVSAHFCVGKDGEIHRYVLEGDTAWANGVFNKPDRDIDWIDMAVSMGTNPNLITLSIEHEGFTGDRMPEAQYQATLALHKYLIEGWGIQVDGDHIIGHNRIDSVNKARCPGTGFDFQRLIVDLTTPPEEPEAQPMLPDEQQESPAPDDLTLIFNYAGDLYNAMIPAGETTYSQQWIATAQKALAIQEAVNRLKL